VKFGNPAARLLPGGDCRLRHLLARFGSATATELPVPEQVAEALRNKGGRVRPTGFSRGGARNAPGIFHDSSLFTNCSPSLAE